MLTVTKIFKFEEPPELFEARAFWVVKSLARFYKEANETLDRAVRMATNIFCVPQSWEDRRASREGTRCSVSVPRDAIHAQLKEGKVSVLARACGENAMRPCRVIAQSYSVPRECLLECGSFTCKIMEGRCGCPRNPHILGCKMTAYVAEVQTLHSANGIRISA